MSQIHIYFYVTATWFGSCNVAIIWLNCKTEIVYINFLWNISLPYECCYKYRYIFKAEISSIRSFYVNKFLFAILVYRQMKATLKGPKHVAVHLTDYTPSLSFESNANVTPFVSVSPVLLDPHGFRLHTSEHFSC